MKSKLKKILVLIVLGMGFLFLPNIKFDFSVEQTTFNNLKNSSVYYGGIQIDALATTNTTYSGNWTWAVMQPWCYNDNGVYVIEDLTIDASRSPTGSGIFIKNSKNDYFIIRNCNVTNAGSGSSDAGIKLENTNHGTLINNNCSNNGGSGIYLLYSEENTISDNTANDNDVSGIYLYQSHYTNITGNTANGNDNDGIRLATECDYNTISGNTADKNIWYGIELWKNCDNNTLSRNTANDNTQRGIHLDNCDNNTISDNTANDNTYIGIYLYQSHYTNITGNTVNYNDHHGIYLDNNCDNNTILGNTANGSDNDGIRLATECDYNTISGNTANGNTWNGICLYQHCDDNTISENTANGNTWNGISIYNECYYNTISGNTVNGNNAFSGIVLEDDCDNNTLSGNTASGNDDSGIHLYNDCDNNTISGNTANNNLVGISINSECDINTLSGNTASLNDYGISLSSNCDRNTLSGNTIKDNVEYGIYLYHCDYNDIIDNIFYNNTQGIRIASGCYINSIYKNFFLENGIHAIDDGTGNKWNITTIGNYWDNWTSPDTTPLDGIVDDPYSDIGGTAESIDYLPIAEDGAPTIDIISPSNDEVFDMNVPSYNVIITDIYVVKKWYTIDGGLHNYTFTGLTGTILKAAWDAISEGSVTLTFYASDIVGKIGTEDVTIKKDNEAPTININSPSSGSVFGVSAPSFNVRITDDYLDEMWYTIDGGLHNYTFTTNSTVNQTAWDAMGNGAITLRFYANDTLGHIGSAGISIIKDTVAPVIIINSPAEGETFGNTAPLFNITITEDNLDSIWYSFDGGLTNYTIINSGTFDQTAWTALSQGNVTITFYARDLAGNEASEAVTVVKIAAGLDPGIIITIVVVSIAGGVAAAAVIFIYLKKRASPK